MRASVLVLLLVALSACATAIATSRAADGPTVFRSSCAGCHDGSPDSRAPTPDRLRGTAPEAIVAALTGGAMRYQGLPLTGAERRAVAEYLSGRSFQAESVLDPSAGRCVSARPMRDPASGPAWNGWGPTLANTHNQPVEAAGLTAADFPRLRVKWALGFHDATSSWAQPTVVGGRLFVGSQSGTVYALDAETGCIVWTYVAEGSVRSAVSVGPHGGGYAAYFSDQRGYGYAVDAESGAEIWKVVVEPHPLVRLTGSVALFDGRLYVPTSSYEEVGKGPDYACCTFRGSIAALDARTGAKIWTGYAVTEEPRVMGVRDDGVESWGPSGGAIWSAPTIDPERKAIYAGVGNTYSGETQPATDAIVAFDMDTGRQLWVQQVTPDDVYGCRRGEANCPEPRGPDHDFGVSPVLTTRRDGKDVLVGQRLAGARCGVGGVDTDEGFRESFRESRNRGGRVE